MKRHHLVLILLLGVIAAVFLNQSRKLRNRESAVRDELNLLREAVTKSPGTAASTPTGRKPRPPVIDSAKFTAGLADILKRGPGTETRKGIEDYMTGHQAQLTTASSSKLREICDLIEKDFPPGQADSEPARQAWLYFVGRVAQSDPAWAFAKLDQAASAANVPLDAVLGSFKKWSSPDGEPMTLSYAAALKKWLDDAQAGGRIEDNNPLVAELRADIAAAQGNSSAAVTEISQLPYLRQRQAAIDYLGSLQTPEARRQAVEELGTALQLQNFPHIFRELAGQQGFEAAREILGSASLTPEKHDLAAAAIASANIGPDTPAKAKWFLDSLRSDDQRAIVEFTDRWTHADYQGAARWMNSLPPGEQRDAAIAGFAPVAAKIDGATAVDWALTLADPAQRRSCLDDVLRKWRETDADAATAYLKERGLDAE